MWVLCRLNRNSTEYLRYRNLCARKFSVHSEAREKCRHEHQLDPVSGSGYGGSTELSPRRFEATKCLAPWRCMLFQFRQCDLAAHRVFPPDLNTELHPRRGRPTCTSWRTCSMATKLHPAECQNRRLSPSSILRPRCSSTCLEFQREAARLIAGEISTFRQTGQPRLPGHIQVHTGI